MQESGRRWGDAATAVQKLDAQAVLDQASPTPYHFLTRARGYSKTDDLGGIAIAIMLEQLPPASRLFALAADKDQGRLLIESIGGFKARTPELVNALKVDTYRVMATTTGTTLEVVAADAPSSWGQRPAVLIADEIAQWSATPATLRLWEAQTSGLAKVPGARLVVLTSAGDPAHWSHGVLEHAMADPLWRVHEVPGPPPWADPAKLAEQRRRLPESSYQRLFENRWTSAEDRLANLDDIRACTTLTDWPVAARIGERYVIGVDLGLKNDRTVAAVCHTEPIEQYWQGDQRKDTGRRVVLDRMQVWSGSRLRAVRTDDVEEWIAAAAASYNRAKVVFDPWQTAGMMQRLQSRGVSCEEFTMSSGSVGRLASTLHILLRNHGMALPDDPELINELANVRLRETSPGVIRMDHDAGQHDDRALALAIAAHDLLNQQASQGGMFFYKRVDTSRSNGEGELAHRQLRSFIDRHPDSWHAKKLAEWDEVERRKRLARGPAGR